MAEKQDIEKSDATQNGQPKKARAKRKVLWLAATLACVAALAAGVQLTLGAFTANDFLKAVAVTGTSQDLFASDVLAPYSSDPTKDQDHTTPVLRSIVAGTSDKGRSFTFKIYNCMLDDQNVFNDKEVTYTLRVTATGAEDGSWSIASDHDGATKGYKFPATRGEVVTYTVTLDESLVDKASFLIMATVNKGEDGNASPGTSKYCLAARVAPVNGSNATPASVGGLWVDAVVNEDTGENNVGDFAAYNCRITVTGEEKVVTVRWGDKVELDSHFETNHPKGAESEGKDPKVSVDRTNRTATFTVKPGSEIINFYRAGSSEPTSWDDLGVTVDGVKVQSTTN